MPNSMWIAIVACAFIAGAGVGAGIMAAVVAHAFTLLAPEEAEECEP